MCTIISYRITFSQRWANYVMIVKDKYLNDSARFSLSITCRSLLPRHVYSLCIMSTCTMLILYHKLFYLNLLAFGNLTANTLYSNYKLCWYKYIYMYKTMKHITIVSNEKLLCTRRETYHQTNAKLFSHCLWLYWSLNFLTSWLAADDIVWTRGRLSESGKLNNMKEHPVSSWQSQSKSFFEA